MMFKLRIKLNNKWYDGLKKYNNYTDALARKNEIINAGHQPTGIKIVEVA